MISLKSSGFTLIELLLVISLLTLLFLAMPGFDNISLFKIVNQEEVQYMVDLLRWSQRRAILQGKRQYLTLDLKSNQYFLYELDDGVETILKRVKLKKVNLIGINRSVTGMEQTFYFTPQGTPAFGCTISLEDQCNHWKVVIAVGSGKLRIDKE
ncbi:MAG: prepilin-type N-terminal cleavage/methylation domain-containing protein [Halanaerobiales bacterium]|nr:prepilin-type N-terminal cleavage/methylation domain-containing protein [Halanaerobiales bacterium]